RFSGTTLGRRASTIFRTAGAWPTLARIRFLHGLGTIHCATNLIADRPTLITRIGSLLLMYGSFRICRKEVDWHDMFSAAGNSAGSPRRRRAGPSPFCPG